MLLDTQITMPNQDPMARQEFSLATRNVRKWIKALPYIDQNVAAQQFYDGLRRSNRQAHPTKQRLTAIEIMRPVAREFLKQQHKYLISQPCPLSKKATEVLKLQQNLISELAVAYKIIIQEAANRDVQLNPKKLIVCIHHAMHYILEQYVTLAQVYSEPPQGYWQDYCQLYKMAEQINMHDYPVKNELHFKNEKSSTECLFKQACLLSLADLHTYGHGEAERIAAYFDSATHLTDLLKEKITYNNENVYFINLSLNKPPRLVAEDDAPISSENRYLNPSKLIANLNKIINSDDNNHAEAILSKAILRKSLAKRLLNKLTSKSKREAKRAKSCKEKLSVVHGLREAINTLANSNFKEDDIDNNTNSTDTDLNLMPLPNGHANSIFDPNLTAQQNMNLDKSSDAWDWVGRGNVVTDSYVAPVSEFKQPQKVESVKFKPFIQSWDINNASNGGYCLKSENTSDYQSQVGDIVLLRREKHPNENWRLGIVRWMQSLSESGIKIGIETLHGDIQAVQVLETHYSQNKFKGLDHILQFTEDTANGKLVTLIAPPNSLEAGECLDILIDDKHQTIIFKEPIDRTISFVRFTYTIQ